MRLKEKSNKIQIKVLPPKKKEYLKFEIKSGFLCLFNSNLLKPTVTGNKSNNKLENNLIEVKNEERKKNNNFVLIYIKSS